MRSLERACRRCIEILNEEIEGRTAKDLCLDRDLYIERIGGANQTMCKDRSRVVAMLETMAKSSGAEESTIKTILRIDKMSPGFWREVDLSVFYGAENIFYKTSSGFMNRRAHIAEEAASMACAVYGYNMKGEWPVPMVHNTHGYTIIDRLAEILDMDSIDLAKKFFSASKARKAAMVAINSLAEDA